MATKKSNAPAPAELDLTTSRIPGGIAHWYTKESELSNRKARRMAAYEMSIMPRLVELQRAQKIVDPRGKTLAEDDNLPGLPTGLTVDESEQILDMTYAGAWAYLKDWTLKNSGEKVPLPESVDDMLDNYPRALVDALTDQAARILAAQMKTRTAAGFTPEDGMDDDDSPTTGLGD